jgi:putative endonuclease
VNIKSFTAQYNCNKLVFFEFYDDIEAAISREKYIKGKSRDFKIQLINEQNSNWENLFEQRDEFNFL